MRKNKVLFLQEYVRENHMKQNDSGGFNNVFLQTRGGKLLRNLVETGLELTKEEYYIDYAYNLVPQVIDRDNSGRAIKYKPPTQREIREESKYFYKKIVQDKPDIIIPTGGIGTKLLIDKTAITRVRGVPEKVTITYSPRYDGNGDGINLSTEEIDNLKEEQENLLAQVERSKNELQAHNNAYGSNYETEKERIREIIKENNNKIELIEHKINDELGTKTHDVWVLPMFSMEYMLVNPSVQNLIESDMVTLEKFLRQGEKAFEPSDVEYNYVDTIEEARRVFLEEVPKAPIVSWDLETNTLRPEYEGAKVLVVSISTKEGTGNTIPLEHEDFTWKPEELQEIYGMLRDMVANPDIIKTGQNI